MRAQPIAFARAGSIVPMGPLRQSAAAHPIDPLELHVFPDSAGDAVGELYEDDGESMAYGAGDWCRTRFRASRRDDATVVRASRDGACNPARRSVLITVHGDGTTSRATAADMGDYEVAVS